MRNPTYIKKVVNKFARTLIKRQDSSKTAILAYLASEKDVVPCFEVSSFLRYVKDERKVHLDCISLKEMGLIEIYDAYTTPLRTTMYKATPFGCVIAKKITDFEEKHNHPTLRNILETTKKGLQEEKRYAEAKKIDALFEKYFSVQKNS